MAQTTIGGHVLIPYPWNWEGGAPAAVRYRYANAIADSPTGAEDRAVLRPNARRNVAFMLRGGGDTESAKMAETLRAALAATRAAVPLWARSEVITGRAGNTLTLAAPCGLYAAGATVLVMDSASGAWTTCTVNSQAANVLTLSAAAPGSGDVAVPVLFGRLAAVRESAEGGGTRVFACQFAETPKPPAVTAQWLPTLQNVYFLVSLDNSGSMVEDIPAVTAAAAKLKELIRDEVYDGDQDQADEFVRVFTTDNERWLEWLARVVDDEQSSKYVCAAFINEAEDIYHKVPNDNDLEPTTQFVDDYTAYAAEHARCDLRVGSVYSIRSVPGQVTFGPFQTHLDNAIRGLNGYAALGPALQTMDVRYFRNISSGQPPVYYLAQILSLIEVFL